jgi:hypothetical protein
MISFAIHEEAHQFDLVGAKKQPLQSEWKFLRI